MEKKIYFLLAVCCLAIYSCSRTSIIEDTPSYPVDAAQDNFNQPAPPPSATREPPAATSRPTQTPVPTELITITKNSSPPTPDLKTGLKIAYRTSDPTANDSAGSANIYEIESPFQIARQVYAYPDGAYFRAEPTWSHNDHYLAFDQTVGGRTAILTVDVETRNVLEYMIAATDGMNIEMQPRLRWSRDDRWLAFPFLLPSEFLRVRSAVVDTLTGESWLLDDGVEFVDWSSLENDQYLYIQHHYLGPAEPEQPNETFPTLHIGQVGVEEPLSSVTNLVGFGPRQAADIVWSPDGKTALSASNLNDSVISINLDNGEWNILPNKFRGIFFPDLWSPDGQWLGFVVDVDEYLWGTSQLNEPPTIKLTFQSYWAAPLAWANDSSYLYYQDGSTLVAISPDNPELIIRVLDLTPFGISGDPPPSIQLWVP